MLLTFSALLTSGEASSEGLEEATADADALALAFAVAFFFAWAFLDALTFAALAFFFGWLAPAAFVLLGWSGDVCAGALFVDWDAPLDCCVRFFLGGFVACLVGALVAGADWCSWAWPGRVVAPPVLPREREEAATRHAGAADTR